MHRRPFLGRVHPLRRLLVPLVLASLIPLATAGEYLSADTDAPPGEYIDPDTSIVYEWDGSSLRATGVGVAALGYIVIDLYGPGQRAESTMMGSAPECPRDADYCAAWIVRAAGAHDVEVVLGSSNEDRPPKACPSRYLRYPAAREKLEIALPDPPSVPATLRRDEVDAEGVRSPVSDFNIVRGWQDDTVTWNHGFFVERVCFGTDGWCFPYSVRMEARLLVGGDRGAADTYFVC